MKIIIFLLPFLLLGTAQAQENPGWSVNGASFQFTMSITSEAFIDSLPPAPAAYWVGAFVGAQCRGVTQAQKTEGGKWRYFLTVYANQESGERVNFKLYYHPLSISLTASNSTTFMGNGVLGSLDTPFSLYMPLYNDRPPFLSGIPDQQIEEGGVFPSLSLKSYLKEYDKNPIAWSVKGNKRLSVAVNASGLLQATAPSPYFNGADTAIITVKDVGTAQLFSASDTVIFTVKSIDSPVEWLPIAGQAIVEGGTFLPIDTKGKAVEHDGHQFLIRAEGSKGLQAVLSPTGMLSITPKSADWFGEEDVFLIAQDTNTAQKLESRIAIKLKATPVDDAPELVNIPTIEIPENAVATALDLRKYLREVDGDATVWLVSASAHLQVQLINAYALTVLKKNPAWQGLDSILVEVKDVTPKALSAKAYIKFQSGAVTGLEEEGILGFKVFPTLFEDVLYWEIQTLKPLSVRMSIHSLQGALIFSEEKRLPSAACWRGNWAAENIPAGYYLMQVCVGENCTAEKLIKR